MNSASDARPPLWRLVWAEVRADHIPLRAAAMSFQTLASLVPMLVILMAVLSSPAFLTQRERVLDKFVEVLVPERPAGDEEAAGDGAAEEETAGATLAARKDVQERFKTRFRATIGALAENLGKISIFSFVVLLVIACMLFRTVEETFNAIWKASTGRPFFIKVAITTAMLFWAPVVLIVSIWLTEQFSDWLPFFGTYVLPLVLTTAAFTAFFMMMPHAKVRFHAALSGAFAAAVLWELTKLGFLIYVGFAVGMSKVYGSLAVVPMLFAWVYLSWMVVLAGAEMAYIVQHHRAIVEQWEARERDRKIVADARDWAQQDAARIPALALAAAIELARRFRGGARGAQKASDLAQALGCEPGTLARALGRLQSAGLLARATPGPKEGDDDPRWLPAADLAALGIPELVAACRGAATAAGEGPSWKLAQSILETLDRDGAQGLAARTLNQAFADAERAAADATPQASAEPSAEPA